MAKYFDVAAAKADGMTDDEIKHIMGQLKLQPKPTETPTPEPQGMSTADAVQPVAPQTEMSAPEPPQQSTLSKIGQGAIDVFKGFFQGADRLGRGVGNALQSNMESDRLMQEEKTNIDMSIKLNKDAIAAKKAGDTKKYEELRAQSESYLEKNDQIAEQFGGIAEQQKTAAEDTKKGAVGTAALFVPGGAAGKGVVPTATRIGSAALSGAGSGYGASEEGQEMQSTLGGAILGAGVAGAGELAGRGLEKIRASRAAKSAQDIKVPTVNEAILNPEVKASAYYAPNKQNLINTANELGLTGTADDMLEQIGGHATRANTQIQTMLQNAPEMQGGQNAIFDDFLQRVDDNTGFLTGDKQWEDYFTKITKRVEKLGENPSPTEVYKLKSKLRGELDTVFTRLAKGNEKMSPDEAIKMELFFALKNSLDTVSPDVRTLNTLQHAMDDLSIGLVKSAKKDANLVFKLPVGADVPIPVTKQRITTSASQMAKNTVSGAANLTGQGVNAAEQAVQTAGPVGRNMALANANESLAQAPTAPAPVTEDMTTQTAVAPTPEPQRNITGYTVEQLGAALTQAKMANDEAAAKDLKALYDMEVEYQKTNNVKPKAVSDATLRTQGKAKTGIEATNLIEKMLLEDPDLARRSTMPNIDLFKGQKRKLYESSVSSIIDALGGLRTGASVSKEQQAFYKSMLPTPGDSKETIKNKLNFLRAELEIYAGTEVTEGMPADQATLQ